MLYRYTMVTNFDKHWDKLGDDETSYPLRMLKGETASDDIFVENSPTTFVKLSAANHQPEGVWEGSVYGFRKTTSRIFFKVKIDRVVTPASQHRLDTGWYVRAVEDKQVNSSQPVNAPLNQLQVAPRTVQSEIRPAIFDELLQTQDWKKFENFTYYLIKLLGIHNAYRFDPDSQSGKADGFFKFNNLAVLYDCTLRTNYVDLKKIQIENYCKQLDVGVIEAAPKIFEEFHHHQKQVWIITRGKSRLIEMRNDIAVKEVSVDKLIDLYEFRLRNAFGANQLENELRSIEGGDES